MRYFEHTDLNYFTEHDYTIEKISTKHGDGFFVYKKQRLYCEFSLLVQVAENDGKIEINTIYFGSGHLGSLGEFSDVYWGDHGYLHFMNVPLVEESFNRLRALGFTDAM